MNFGQAIEELKKGNCVCRETWSKGTFVCKQIPATIPPNVILTMQSLPFTAKTIILDSFSRSLSYNNQMLIIDETNKADSWLPTSSDIFAEDWQIATTNICSTKS